MEYRTLGKTGLRVTRVGFGGLPIQRATESEAAETVHAAADAGINFIDTARSYTVSEEYIGKALTGMRDKFVLASKGMGRDKATMAAQIDESLRQLRTDHLDMYQTHNPTPEDFQRICASGGALEALQEAKAAGKIAHLGVTTHYAQTFVMALEQPWVESLMFPYSIVETQIQPHVAECAEKNIGLICMKPLAGGAISDPALALRFLLSDPGVSVVIPGMYSPEEVRKNVAAAEGAGELTKEDMEAIARIRQELSGNFCRRCNYCAPCTAGISIPNVFMYAAYFERYGLQEWASSRYFDLEKRGKDCLECGVCETRCPYHLPIREMMKKVSAEFGE